MHGAPQQKVLALNNADKTRLHEQRAVVEKYLADENSVTKFKTPAGKLGTLRALLQAGVFKKEDTYKLQSMGVVLGDVFVQELHMEWIIVEDAHGRDPAVRVPGTSIILFPLTMISKRIERGEQVDVFELFNGTAAEVDKLKKHGTN